MEKYESFRFILAEWLQMPESERTDANAVVFAFQMAFQRSELAFQTDGDPYQDIKAFLNNYLVGSSATCIDVWLSSEWIM